MPRSIWTGVISFGMVSVPVRLYTATESKDVSFRLLHKKDGTRLKQLRWCPTDDAEVEWSDIVRGYEYQKDQHVVLTDEDLAKLPLPSKHTIDLNAFVRAEEIDSIYYEKSYYLEPEETGRKPYALLMRALQEKGLLAIAKIAIRNKERLCALRPREGSLVLETLFFPDEIRAQQTSDSPEPDISDKELAMANSLIDMMLEPFKPEDYVDEYRDALMKLIEAKLEGIELEEPAAPAKGKVIDLMSALKASVDKAKGRKGGEEQRRDQGRRKAAV